MILCHKCKIVHVRICFPNKHPRNRIDIEYLVLRKLFFPLRKQWIHTCHIVNLFDNCRSFHVFRHGREERVGSQGPT